MKIQQSMKDSFKASLVSSTSDMISSLWQRERFIDSKLESLCEKAETNMFFQLRLIAILSSIDNKQSVADNRQKLINNKIEYNIWEVMHNIIHNKKT